MQNIKERMLKEKQQPNIYMQKTQGPKNFMQSPNIDQKFKSKILLDKQNLQPNVQTISSKQFPNSFGAAKIMMRQSVDDLKSYLAKQGSNGVSQKLAPTRLQNGKNIGGHMITQLHLNQNQIKPNAMSKSNNFQKCQTERITYANTNSKKHMKTEADQEQLERQGTTPIIIADCQMIKSEKESSQNSEQEAVPNYSKSYRRNFDRRNPDNHILVHQSLNYQDTKPRDTVTFGPNADKGIRKYQFSRQQERKMKNEIVNSIILSSKAEMMRSCDFDIISSLKCLNHPNKKAKYRLTNSSYQDEQEESFYCSKCAVNIAKQRIPIEEISADDRRMIMSRRTQRSVLMNSVELISQKSKRQQQFINFQKRLDLLKHKISAKLNLFNQKSQSMTKLDKKIQLTISNYDQLIKILNQMRKEEIEKEDKTRRQKCRDISLKKIQLSAILQNIKDTVSDINNERTKMMALKSKDFSFMFDSFVNKITSYQEYLKNLEQSQLANQMSLFDQKINSQDLDEETLIDTIFKEMYERLTQPKLQALANSPNCRKVLTEPIKEAQMESGGSSLFCLEIDESADEPKEKAFRKLFDNMKGEELSNEETGRNLQMPRLIQSLTGNTSEDFQRSFRTVRCIKEQNFVPSMRRYD